MPYEMEIKDYELRYLNTYVSYKEDDENRPFMISAIGSSPTGIKFIGSVLQGNEWKDCELSVKDPKLDLTFPETGAINLGSGFAIYMNRIPKHQWKETLYSEVVEFYDPFNKERKVCKKEVQIAITNKSLLRAIFNNVHYNFSHIVNLIYSQKRVAGAFSKEWVVGIQHGPNRVCVIRNGMVVGIATTHNTVVLSKNVEFLKDELNQMGITVKITGEEK